MAIQICNIVNEAHKYILLIIFAYDRLVSIKRGGTEQTNDVFVVSGDSHTRITLESYRERHVTWPD